MPVPIPADPSPEPHQRRQSLNLPTLKTSRLPRLPQMNVRPRHRLRKHFPQIMQRILQLRLDRRPRHMNLPCPPQALQLGLQHPPHPLLLPRREHRMVHPVQQLINLPVPLPHRLPLRLRRMRRQHRLHRHLPQNTDNLLPTQPSTPHRRNLIRPQPSLRRRPQLLLALPPHIRRRPLLHYVQ